MTYSRHIRANSKSNLDLLSDVSNKVGRWSILHMLDMPSCTHVVNSLQTGTLTENRMTVVEGWLIL